MERGTQKCGDAVVDTVTPSRFQIADYFKNGGSINGWPSSNTHFLLKVYRRSISNCSFYVNNQTNQLQAIEISCFINKILQKLLVR